MPRGPKAQAEASLADSTGQYARAVPSHLQGRDDFANCLNRDRGTHNYELASCPSMAGNNGGVCIAWSSSHEDHHLPLIALAVLAGIAAPASAFDTKGFLPESGPQLWRHSQLNTEASARLRARSLTRDEY